MIYYGEVLKGYPPSNPKNKYKDRYEYDVIVWFPSGSQLVSNVRTVGDFNGPDDFTETILRGSQDDNGKGGYVMPEADKASAQAGTRVLVAFTGDAGNVNYYSGFILSTISHPKNITKSNKDKNSLLPSITEENAKPQNRSKFNGVFMGIDSFGQYRVQYNGLAVIKPNKEPLSTLPKVEEQGQLTLDFLQKSVFRLVDNNKQGLAIDSFGKFISLSNKITPPVSRYGATESLNIDEVKGTEKPKGQEIRLDQQANTLWMRSSNIINTVSVSYLNKNDKYTVDSKSILMKDNSGTTIQAESGRCEVKANDIKLDDSASCTLQMKGGALNVKATSLKLDDSAASLQITGGKVALGTGSAEVVTLAISTIDSILNSNPLVITAIGPGQASPALIAALTQVKTLLNTIKK